LLDTSHQPEAGGNDRYHAVTREFFMNKFRALGFIDDNGSLEIHGSLLSVVLLDQPRMTKG